MFAAAAAAALALVAAPAGSGDTDVAASGERVPRVRVYDNFFDRRSVSIPVGGKVIWLWRGEYRHNVRFKKVPEGASRRSAKARKSGRWSRRFGVPGTYKYVCTLYSGMRGTVTVRSAVEPSGGPAGANY
jgi:plastocyanin